MKQSFIKLNAYLFEDKFNLLDKLQNVCCDRNDCHTHTLSYQCKSPHIFILSLFHKGSFQYNIKYDFKKKVITFKTKETTCNCFEHDIENFINKNEKRVKYWFRKEVLPIHTAIQENQLWYSKKKILNEYLYDDVIGVIKDYLTYFRKCDCGKVIHGNYNQCYKCYTQKI